MSPVLIQGSHTLSHKPKILYHFNSHVAIMLPTFLVTQRTAVAEIFTAKIPPKLKSSRKRHQNYSIRQPPTY